MKKNSTKKTYQFRNDVIEKLEEIAEAHYTTQTATIERLIREEHRREQRRRQARRE